MYKRVHYTFTRVNVIKMIIILLYTYNNTPSYLCIRLIGRNYFKHDEKFVLGGNRDINPLLTTIPDPYV